MQHVEILVKGHVDVDWANWLEGVDVSHTARGETSFAGWLPDQSALYGLLNRLSDLGLQLISISARLTEPESMVTKYPKPQADRQSVPDKGG